MHFENIYVLDTNIILNEASSIVKISKNGENLIVLPETMLDEVDAKKSGFGEINYQAREFARILSAAKIEGSEVKGDYTITRVSVGKENQIKIDIISKESYDIKKDTEKSILNDRKILIIAKSVKELYKGVFSKDVVFLSMDVMARTRAVSYNIKTEPLLDNNIGDSKYEYIKTLEVESSIFNEIGNKNIIDVDPAYKIENYNYFFKSEDGNSTLASICKGKIRIIDELALRKNRIQPRNLGQQFAMNGLLNDNFNVVLIEALAGSGKTLLSVACAINLVKDGKYDKISFIRNSIESTDKGEEVGFLSGNEEKFKIYNYPLYDTLSMIARAKDDNISREEEESMVEGMIQKYNIETPWVGEIRGRTISKSVVILDESQNMSKKTMQTIISRLDKDCKLIIIGSNKQIDNQYVNKHTNGLSVIIDASLKENEDIRFFATKLDKVVRGPITKWAESIFNTRSEKEELG